MTFCFHRYAYKKVLFHCFVFFLSFTVRNRVPLILHTCFFYSVEWNQVVSSSRFIFFVFLSFKLLTSLSSNNLFLFFVLPSFHKMKPSFCKGPYSFMASFSTTNIIFCFVFLSFKTMEPGFSSNMCICFMLLSTMEPVVKEESIYVYKCI